MGKQKDKHILNSAKTDCICSLLSLFEQENKVIKTTIESIFLHKKWFFISYSTFMPKKI